MILSILEVVLSSPGCRLELLQVLRTKAVMAWQVYQSPGAALNTGETRDSCKPSSSQQDDVNTSVKTHPVVFSFVRSTAVSDGGLCPPELSCQQL